MLGLKTMEFWVVQLFYFCRLIYEVPELVIMCPSQMCYGNKSVCILFAWAKMWNWYWCRETNRCDCDSDVNEGQLREGIFYKEFPSGTLTALFSQECSVTKYIKNCWSPSFTSHGKYGLRINCWLPQRWLSSWLYIYN